MTETWNLLLGLRELSFADADVVLGWRYPLPAYVWAALVLSALGYAGWSYSGLLGSRPMRVVLACLRALWIMLLVLLLAGPVLVKPDEQVEPDWLLMLVDRSASMAIHDVWVDSPEGDRVITRDADLRQALLNQKDAFGPAAMGPNRQVVWLGFGAQAFEFNPLWVEPWDAPTDSRTALRTAMEQALDFASGHPISALVLMTDGRSPQATDLAWVQQLQQQAVSVFVVPMGSDQMPLDFSVVEVNAPKQAFINDRIPIQVLVQHQGGDGQTIDRSRVKVSLVDVVTQDVVDETTWDQVALNEPVKLTGRSARVGPAHWEVRVDYDDPQGQAERVTANNRYAFEVELIDRPIRVLYIEGYPRWEYRYLKNMLMREKSIASSILLLSADRHFVQEGDISITRLPQTMAEINAYDVVVVGDVPVGFFSAKQQVLLRDHVASRGGGLLWIGGEQSTPRSYDGSSLASLLPMQYPARVGSVVEPTQLRPTPLADQLEILQSQAPDLPPLYWHQDLGLLKPTAEVLAITTDSTTSALVTRLRYGAGQSLYVGTDETWRWRYGRGELFFERFWIQLIRMLGRDRVAQTQGRGRLSLSHQRVAVDETVSMTWTTQDAALMARQLPSLAVTVTGVGNMSGQVVDELTLRPTQNQAHQEVELAGEAPTQQTYVATWQPTARGRFSLRITEPALDDLGIRAELEVVAPDDELREPMPDHQRLIALAQQTGGQVVPLNALHTLPDLVPNRSIKTPNDIREPLWHAPLMLGLMLLLLTLEWIGRKTIQLV